MTNEYKPRNFRIITHTTKTRILHIEDALDLGKLRLELWEYQKGNGAKGHVEHYMDVHDARLLFTDLATGHLAEPYQELKGTYRDGQPQSRTLTVAEVEARQPIKITVSNGPGEVIGAGAIKPKKGAEQTRISILLDRRTARKIALAVLGHIAAWEVATYYHRLSQGTWRPPTEEHVDIRTGEIVEEASDFTVPLAGTSTQGECGSKPSPSTSPSEATAADFWALASEALKAGVSHNHIQEIANTANGDGWADAIATLKAEMGY